MGDAATAAGIVVIPVCAGASVVPDPGWDDAVASGCCAAAPRALEGSPAGADAAGLETAGVEPPGEA
ncbi:putative protein without homology [Propionibacterium freudenreichii subsp. shermanii]|nr:putative protein without homology [Propionibacterium freudenreichii subsp. shermanii]